METPKRERVKKDIMSITDSASARIKFLLEKRGKASIGIRVGIKSGGCNGMTYSIEYADEKTSYDEIISQKDVVVLIDPKAVIYLIGSEMDYIEEKMKSGFVFNNPNAKGSCGCGESFNF